MSILGFRVRVYGFETPMLGFRVKGFQVPISNFKKGFQVPISNFEKGFQSSILILFFWHQNGKIT